ncbi:hypothetical protein [Helicobacter sp. 11S02596-1]|uniref:hypothetical protein n=1 Tax=Helicobacter sp. 11S02596-1 TaxID=1476194 RepID=UPI0015DE778A|nr:hypothetical protein [Helicobacter sp. 11S02596-1]
MLEPYVYRMYGDDEIDDEGFDEDYPDYDDDDDETPSYSGYDDDDYESADEEYEED